MTTRASRSFLGFVVTLCLCLPAIGRAQQTGQRTSVAAARSQEDSVLVRREGAQWEALKTRDTTAFARLMGRNVIDVDLTGIKRTSAASTARYVLGCQVTAYTLSDLRVTYFASTAVVAYKAVIDATC